MRRLIALALTFVSTVGISAAQAPSPSLYSDLRWRNIGPFRGGWSTCVEGIADEPDVFYFGAAVGSVWRSDDAGRTWEPLFQYGPSASVGAIAIAPSNPKILYVGTGQVDARYDISSGRGVYRSDDAGQTWRPVGLSGTRAIGRIIVDPKNPDIVLVAALGHMFGPNPDRGVFRTEDGGATWKKVLFIDENTGAVDLTSAPEDASILYASTWQARNYPWLSYFQPSVGPGSGVYKSTDEGRTWKRLAGGEWPEGPLGRIGLAAAPGGRVYASVQAPSADAAATGAGSGAGGRSHTGLYRSDDGGATWKWISREEWLGSDYFGRLTADPARPDRVYAMGQSVRRSDDAGATWQIVKGAPGGDDYHFLWINPKHPDHLAVASDQGTVVTVNGGRTWSSWYNQPTGQFYHLAADDRFPYWVYSGQQDSGTVGIASRSDYGALSYREWRPVGGDERDYDVPDPGDPETVYGSGLGGALARFDSRTGQVAAIAPHVESTYARRPTQLKYRYTWITPIAVSPRPPHAIYHGAQVLFRSTDRGRSWTTVSPDLSGAVPATKGCDGPVTLENARPCGFGVIYSIALSPSTDEEIWIGTDDGRVQTTRDAGRSWTDVTPRGLPPWSKVSSLDVSPLDPATVYAAVDGHRLDDFTPHLYRTHDRGRSWSSITEGLPGEGFTDVIRADPVRRGLLYAGTDTGVFVSFDDGDHWQSLRMNLPTSWVRDLLVHGDDLIAATQGRALWILDDVSPLRQLTPAVQQGPLHLFRPATAFRLRRDENRDTPPPPETPLGKNPPAGAVIDYLLSPGVRGPVTLEILDPHGNLVRRFSSDDRLSAPEAERYFTATWLAPEAPPAATPGHHRFVWDLRYPRPRAAEYEYSIAAIWGEGTPAEPEGVLAPPGEYSVRLTAGGESQIQPLTLKMDPRVHIAPEAVERQFDSARQAESLMGSSLSALDQVRAARKRLEEARLAGTEVDRKLAALEEGPGSFARANQRLSAVFGAIESADAAPTAAAAEELEAARRDLTATLAQWTELQREASETGKSNTSSRP